MKRILLAALVLSLNLSTAFAQETCESKAISKEGRPLAGAAKTSFLKKCKRDSCQAKAVGSNGRPLAGAAKKSFMAALPIVSSFSVHRPAHHRVYSTPGGCRHRIGRAQSQNEVPRASLAARELSIEIPGSRSSYPVPRLDQSVGGQRNDRD